MMVTLLLLLVIAMTTFPPSINGLVPPKTPVLSGFEPAVKGSYRELVCDASQPDAGTITYKWYKYATDRNNVEIWESNGPIGTSQKYVFNSGPVSGKYKCRASNSAGTRDSEWGDLYVYKPCNLYTVTVSPAKPAIIGSTFTLYCNIPNPSGFTVNWVKKTDAITEGTDEATAIGKGCHAPDNSRYSWSSCSPPSFSSPSRTFNLKITNAQPSDFAYWICKDFGLSCESNPVKPVVQALPGTPQITGFPSGPVVPAGTQLNLKCVASPTGDTYDWYKNGTKVTTSLTYDFQVTKESAGVYKCVARNAVGSTASSDKTLVVYHKADSVVVSSGKTSSYVGEKDKFTCTVIGGSPTPTLKIYFKRSGGTPVEVTQGQGRVMAKEDNQAEYYCEAKVTGYPALDMTSSRKTYSVTFPPSGIQLSETSITVKEGVTKTITCNTTSSSNPAVSGVSVKKKLGTTEVDVTETSRVTNGANSGKDVSIDIKLDTNRTDNGTQYICSFIYASTTFTKTATVNVQWSATELKMVAKPSVPITAGVGVTMKCETDSSNSGSPGTISWYRNGQQITSGVTPSTTLHDTSDGGTIYMSQRTFTARKEDNQAKYECKINNQASFRKDVTITVNFPPNGIQLSETSITVKEGVTKTLTCSTKSSSNPAVSGVSVKKKLGTAEVNVTGTPRETNGAYSGKNVSIDIKLDTNRKDNDAQYICTFTYDSTNFTETATVNVQFNPSEIMMLQSPPTTVHEGQQITIICETDSANPVADITFYRQRTGGTWEKLTSGITYEDRAGEYNGKIRKSTLAVTANRFDTQAVFKCEVKKGSFLVKQTTTTVNVYFPPTVKMSSNPTPVKEGDTLTLTCTASDGNPTQYSYKWFYKNKETPNETSKDYTITNIKYTQSGMYRCQAINYSPDGKADGSLKVDILYKAKWNPELPEVFTVASKINTPMEFVLHVIANPSSTKVTWFFRNKTAINNNITFTATKVNDTAYTLSKASVGVEDYGNYTVNVTNTVGISTFIFELEKAGPPDPPCCLTLVSATAVSLTLTFKSNFAGGTPQTFTIEKKTSGGNAWDIAVEGIADPGFRMNVTQKIAGLDNDTKYEFHVKATNADGDSGYGDILEVKTEAAPNVELTVIREDNVVTASWPKLSKEYTKIQIKFCPVKGGSCGFHDVADPTSLKSSFPVKEGDTYTYSMMIFDGEEQVFASPVVSPPPSNLPDVPAIAGAVGGVLFVLIIIAVVLATVFILKKKRVEKEAKILNPSNRNGINGGEVNPGFTDLDDRHNSMNDGFSPYEDSVEMTTPSSSIQIDATVLGGAEYAVVEKGSKKPLIGDAYAEVDFKKKKGGKKGPPPPVGQAYAEVNFSKKSKGKKGKGKAPMPSAGPGGQAYADVDFTKKSKKGKASVPAAGPEGAVYAAVNKKEKAPDVIAVGGDVYAEVSKPRKPSPGKGESDDQAVYANVPNGDEEIYEDVRKDEPTETGYRQPKEAYQVGVDGTIYSQVRISLPKHPDVIRGIETIEEPYASVDFMRQAPPLPEPVDPDDPNDPGFVVLL